MIAHRSLSVQHRCRVLAHRRSDRQVSQESLERHGSCHQPTLSTAPDAPDRLHDGLWRWIWHCMLLDPCRWLVRVRSV